MSSHSYILTCVVGACASAESLPLERAGVSLGGELVLEYSGVIDGGVREHGSFRRLLTVDAEFDLEASLGLEGGTAFAQFLSVNAERGGSLDAGDFQGYSNIENDRSLDALYEAWCEQRFLDDRVRLKIGKVDANSEFAFVGVAGEFANSSAGFSPTVQGFPSYPDPAFSVNAFVVAHEWDGASLTLGYGLYDGAAGVDGVPTGRRGPSTFFSDELSGDYFHVGQAEVAWERGRASLGGWLHTGDFQRFDGGGSDHASGLFMTGEHRLTGGGGEEGRGVYVFGQYAWADDDVSEAHQHVGGGVVARGLFGGREGDSAGVYATFVDLSDASGAGFARDEFAVEVYYRLAVTEGVWVQPGAQWVMNPSGDPAIDDAIVLGVRVGVEF